MEDKTQRFIDNKGWSANKFYPLFDEFKTLCDKYNITLTIGRTVAYAERDGFKIKLYPHYQGRGNDIISVVHNKKHLFDFYYQEDVEKLVKRIILYITINVC